MTKIPYLKRVIWQKSFLPQIDSNIFFNFENILENYSTKKTSNCLLEKNSTLNSLNNENLYLKISFNSFEILTNKLLNKNEDVNVKNKILKFRKIQFSETLKQNFKIFRNFSFFNKNLIFNKFLESILFKFCVESIYENINLSLTSSLTGNTKIKNREPSSQVLTNFSFKKFSQENNLVKNFKNESIVPDLEEFIFLTFSQSFTGQTYFQNLFKKHNYRRKNDGIFNSENNYVSITQALNVYSFEVWKKYSYYNFSKTLNKTLFLENQLFSQNLKFDILLNLFYIFQKFILPKQIEASINEEHPLTFFFKKSKELLKVPKIMKFNFLTSKQFLNLFCSFYYREFFLNTAELNLDSCAFYFYFQTSWQKLYNYNNTYQLPKFVKFTVMNPLNFKQIFIQANLKKLTNFSKTKNYPVPLNRIYSTFEKHMNTHFKHFKFIDQCFKTYFDYEIFNQKRWNLSNLKTKNLFFNETYLNSEKLFFEALQKLSLKNEKNVTCFQKKEICFYFFFLKHANQKDLFFYHFDILSLKECLFSFLFFNIWTQKNDFCILKNQSLFLQNFNLTSEVKNMNATENEVFSAANKFVNLNLYYVDSFLFIQNSNKFKFNEVSENIKQMNKFTYLKKIKQIIKINSSQTQEKLIYKLTPLILSWSYQYKFIFEVKEWNQVDKIMSQYLWQWACRRHNNKSKKWIQAKYFFSLNKELWVFGQILNDSSDLKFQIKKELKFIYLPFHGQVYNFLRASENFSQH